MTLLTVLIILVLAAAAQARGPKLATLISEQIVLTWRCEEQLERPRTKPEKSPWNLGQHSTSYKRWVLATWTKRKQACRKTLHEVAAINRNLYRIASCETGGKPGQNGLPDWAHRARSEHLGHYYEGALGFLDTTWDGYKPAGYPAGAHQAAPGQQYTVARRLVERFGGYSSWPACSIRLGLR